MGWLSNLTSIFGMGSPTGGRLLQGPYSGYFNTGGASAGTPTAAPASANGWFNAAPSSNLLSLMSATGGTSGSGGGGIGSALGIFQRVAAQSAAMNYQTGARNVAAVNANGLSLAELTLQNNNAQDQLLKQTANNANNYAQGNLQNNSPSLWNQIF